jgi:hypothetical protein
MAAAGHIARGFVQSDINMGLGRFHRFSVDLDPIRFRIDTGAEFDDNAAVDGNPSGCDVFLAPAARTDAGGGKKFLKAHLRHGFEVHAEGALRFRSTSFEERSFGTLCFFTSSAALFK